MKERDSWYRPRYRVRAMKDCIKRLLNEARRCEGRIRAQCWDAGECKEKLRWIKGVFKDYAEHLGITLLFTIDLETWQVKPYLELFEEKKVLEPIKPKV